VKEQDELGTPEQEVVFVELHSKDMGELVDSRGGHRGGGARVDEEAPPAKMACQALTHHDACR
jgi:hypothetical protein